MKEAIINGVLLVRYSECFSCGEVLICDVIFLNIPAEYVHIDFAYSLVQKSTKWLWRRTGNARCERCCCNCMKKREKSILSFLKSGHISSPQKKNKYSKYFETHNKSRIRSSDQRWNPDGLRRWDRSNNIYFVAKHSRLWKFGFSF